MNAFSQIRLDTFLAKSQRPVEASQLGWVMRELISSGLANLPFPGNAKTLDRWRALASVAAADLCLAKLYEGHTDALAIQAELGVAGDKSQLWATWAAEPPGQQLLFESGKLNGCKPWCSGAAMVDRALVTAWTPTDQAVLAAVDLRQPKISIRDTGWNAVGMAATRSVPVDFLNAEADLVGQPDSYLERPGFWHGGAGIAAVWFGGACAVAEKLLCSGKVRNDPHAAAHLGAIDAALTSARALLAETAAWIDQNPKADAFSPAMRVRAAVEAAALETLDRTDRALGAGPLCVDAEHARRSADLRVLLRQSHAECDLCALGKRIAAETPAWKL